MEHRLLQRFRDDGLHQEGYRELPSNKASQEDVIVIVQDSSGQENDGSQMLGIGTEISYLKQKRCTEALSLVRPWP